MRQIVVKGIMVVAILSVAAFAVPWVGADAAVADPIEFVGGSAAERAAVLEAAGLYAERGLELPQLVVEFSGSCGVHDAIYVYGSGVVRFCTDDFSRQLVLHELGHAWDDHNMSDSQRAAYASRFGQGKSWFDSDVDHDNRTYERFANTVTAVAKGMLSQDEFAALIGEVSSSG